MDVTRPKRFGILARCFALGCLLVVSGVWQINLGASDRLRNYNILLVTIDTLRADHVGIYGHEKIQTPNLDRLAAQGVLFEDATAQVPLTPPSHASMFTGTYPTSHQVRNTGGFVLDSQQTTLAELLRDQGWTTGAVIAASVLDRVFGLDQGFDTYDDDIDEGSAFVDSSGLSPVLSKFPYRRADEVVDKALEWLDEVTKQKPYLLWVHLYDPHAPYDPPPSFKQPYGSPYDGEIAFVDHELGRLFAVVRKKSSPDSTIIVVLSDHGESLGDHGEYTHGVFLYDSTLRVPWIMSGPGVPRGKRIGQQARTIDLLPTILSLLGGEIPNNCQGVSLVPAFSGKRTGSTYSYIETLFPKLNLGWAELRGIRTNKWKYIRAPRAELYDLEEDPEELFNVIERFPAAARRLENQLRQVTFIPDQEGIEEIRLKTIDRETEERLRSLGYVSMRSPKGLQLTGEGIDPKDRTHILKLVDEATTTAKAVTSAQRIRLLERALQEDPTNPLLFFILGEGYEKNGRDEEALQLYEKALELEIAANSKIYVRMANLYGRQRRYGKSVAAFEKAVELEPSDVETQNRLATAYLLGDRFEDAERILKGIMVLDDQDAQAHNSLGWLALKRGDTEQARIHLRKALESNPDFLETYVNVGMMYKGLGDFLQAEKAFRTFLAKAGNSDKPEVKSSIAQVERELEELTADH